MEKSPETIDKSTPLPNNAATSLQSTETLDQSSLRRSNRTTKGHFTSKRFEDEVFLSMILNKVDPSSYIGQLAYAASLNLCPTTGYLDTLDPRVYLAHRKPFLGHDPDSPTLYEAINGPQSNEYMTAMKLEIEALEKQQTWTSSPAQKITEYLRVPGYSN